MVSFSCEGCNDTMVKKKVAPHINWCQSAVTCIDCGKTFDGQTFKQHNQCMTEDEKYQGKLYQPKTPKVKESEPRKVEEEPKEEKAKKEDTKEKTKDSKKAKDSKAKDSKAKDSKSKDSKSKHKESKSKPAPQPVRVTKQKSLKKVLKQLRKEHDLKEEDLLERIALTPEGQLVLN